MTASSWRSEVSSVLYETLSLVGDACPGTTCLFETPRRAEATVFRSRLSLKESNVDLSFYEVL